MAKSLKILIEMAGAEEIKRQLEGVGEAGEQAFNKILKAAQEAGGFKELDPAFLKQAFDDLGTKAPQAIGKITQAVKSASRMETLVNALTSVENGLGGIQKAATAVDNALGRQLVRSLTMVARLLPAAFAAATVGMIASTTKSVLELDRAAIQLGLSIGELDKARQIFTGIGMDAKTAAQGIADVFEKMKLEDVKKAIEEADTKFLTFRGLDVLRKAAEGFGEAADLARKKLAELGKLDERLSPLAQKIEDIRQSTMGFTEQLIAMLKVFSEMGNTSERNRLIFERFGKTFGTAIIQMLNAGVSIDDIKKKLDELKAKTEETAAAATRLEFAWNKLKAMFTGEDMDAKQLDEIARSLNFIRQVAEAIGQVPFIAGSMNMGNTLRELEMIGQVLTSIGQTAKDIWNWFVEGASAAIQDVLRLFGQMPEQILSFFAGLGDKLWEGIVASAKSAWELIIHYIQTAIDKVRQFFGMGGGQPQGAGAQAMARGGLLGGRGTGTSDSNLAWLSRGEHVMPARAVRQPGVLQLLEALRRSGGNLRGVLDRMGHFAMGGMVRAPAFASGGMVGGMSNVTIQFPGVQPITGLRASSAVVDELRRSAALAQVRSGGRKPSRYT